ncbi:MAG: glutamine-hydrolyzing carbamoyl-phosphate synthase small subunit [Bacillota bacterium]|nr:glutamine-hydrolyzing carbamoyl-phosphate synthase small subunit [Bacillota bacterium]
MRKAVLALEDGTVFTGEAFAAPGETWGEVVFNTGMTGYEGVLTDPSYCGQIVVMTYPLIGNYGTNREDFESARIYARGLVVREACDDPSNWRSEHSLRDLLLEQGIVAVTGVDTRALTRRLRRYGTMRGILGTLDVPPEELVARARACPQLSDQDLLQEVAHAERTVVPGTGPRVALINLGAKLNIVRSLSHHQCEIVIVPPTATAEEILAEDPAGVVISNGPGDPERAVGVIETVRGLVGKKPLFGICLGHQVIALAVGARTYKLKFGHRGANHPVQDTATGRVYITSHNHGFAVDEASLEGLDLEVSHRNLNDGTVEGLRHRRLPIFAVQYHPEASPGPHDSEYLFKEFLTAIAREEEK